MKRVQEFSVYSFWLGELNRILLLFTGKYSTYPKEYGRADSGC